MAHVRFRTHVLTALLGAVLLLIPSQAVAAVAAHHGRAPSSYYLQLGDSLAAGYQPGAGADLSGGYADNVLAAIRETSPGTRLVNLGCVGESTGTMIAGGKCPYGEGGQLAAAVAFLREHRGATPAITLSIGANDVVPLAVGGCTEVGCLDLNGLSARLTFIIAALREAAPDAEIVVLNLFNPALAFWLSGPAGQGIALASVPLHATVNGVIQSVATGVGAKVADVASVFRSLDSTPVPFPTPSGSAPASVALVCAWTWMCSALDFHANDAGYDVLGSIVVARLIE